MVDKIMKSVDYVQNAIVGLQATRAAWSTSKTGTSTAEINITYDDLVEKKARLTALHENFFQAKTATSDPAHDATFETLFTSLRALQVDIGEIKRKRQEATLKANPTPFRLEKIKLPLFNGKFSEWHDFQDLFISGVVNNSTLTDSERMVYLKSSLTGEAESIVSSFSTATTSFTDAWDLVKSRFSNQREIVFSHIRKFYDLKSVQESASGIRKVTDSINELIRSLKALSVPVEHWDLIIIFIALTKLDPESKKQWLLTQRNSLPVLKGFISFLEQRATALVDSTKPKSSSSFKPHSSGKSSSHHVSNSSKSSNSKFSCVKCNESHHLHNCKEFISLPLPERRRYVSESNLCFNCLFKNHSVSNCKITASCKKCNKRHHTLLHHEVKPSASNSSPDSPTAATAADSTASVNSSSSTSSNHSEAKCSSSSQVVLFETGIGLAQDSAGQRQQCRIFFDPGSESHFITENCVNRLGLRRQKTCVSVGGITGSKAGLAKGIVNLKVFSRCND